MITFLQSTCVFFPIYQVYILYTFLHSYYLLPFTKQMCVSWDDQILYISGIHVEHILTQWLHFTFYKELECALASVLLLSNQGYVLYTYSYYLLLFKKALVCSFRRPYIVYIRDTCKYNVYISKIVNCKLKYNMKQGQNITKFWPKTTM